MGLLCVPGASDPKPETEILDRGLSISIPNNPFLNSLIHTAIRIYSLSATLSVIYNYVYSQLALHPAQAGESE